MTVLPRSSVANFFIPSPASAWAHRGTATMASHPCLTDIRRTLYEDSAAINRLRGRPRGARTRYHGPKALQIRQDRAADTDDHAGEEEPPSETRAPGPGHTWGRLGRPPETTDREGSDIGRRGPRNSNDRQEESEDREAEGKARRLDLEEHLELRAEACGGRHQSSATRQVDKKGRTRASEISGRGCSPHADRARFPS